MPCPLTSWPPGASWRSAGCARTWGPCCGKTGQRGRQFVSKAGRARRGQRRAATACRPSCSPAAKPPPRRARSPLAAGVALTLRLLDAVPAAREVGRAPQVRHAWQALTAPSRTPQCQTWPHLCALALWFAAVWFLDLAMVQSVACCKGGTSRGRAEGGVKRRRRHAAQPAKGTPPLRPQVRPMRPR